MPNNNVQTVKIGGVTFNKADVKSSEVIVKDGKKINSVFLQDGTHVEFPTQSENNQSSVSQSNHTYTQPAYKYGYNARNGKIEYHLTYEEKEDPSKKITDFHFLFTNEHDVFIISKFLGFLHFWDKLDHFDFISMDSVLILMKSRII